MYDPDERRSTRSLTQLQITRSILSGCRDDCLYVDIYNFSIICDLPGTWTGMNDAMIDRYLPTDAWRDLRERVIKIDSYANWQGQTRTSVVRCYDAHIAQFELDIRAPPVDHQRRGCNSPGFNRLIWHRNTKHAGGIPLKVKEWIFIVLLSFGYRLSSTSVTI